MLFAGIRSPEYCRPNFSVCDSDKVGGREIVTRYRRPPPIKLSQVVVRDQASARACQPSVHLAVVNLRPRTRRHPLHSAVGIDVGLVGTRSGGAALQAYDGNLVRVRAADRACDDGRFGRTKLRRRDRLRACGRCRGVGLQAVEGPGIGRAGHTTYCSREHNVCLRSVQGAVRGRERGCTARRHHHSGTLNPLHTLRPLRSRSPRHASLGFGQGEPLDHVREPAPGRGQIHKPGVCRHGRHRVGPA